MFTKTYFPSLENTWKKLQTFITGILLKEQTAPATPSADHVRIYVDSSDGKLKIKNDAGIVKILSDALISPITSADIGDLEIVNADISASAAIAYSKLALALSIVNGDISASAAIALSKLGNVGADNEFIRSNGTSWVSEAVVLGGSLEFLTTYEASIAEGTFTYTPAQALSTDTYSHIIVVVDLEATASFILQAVINGVEETRNYSEGARRIAAAQTLISITADAKLQLASASIVNAANTVTMGKLELFLNDSGSNDILGHSVFNGTTTTSGNEDMSHSIITAATTITSINIKTSTSTWKIGSKITIYGVKRS